MAGSIPNWSKRVFAWAFEGKGTLRKRGRQRKGGSAWASERLHLETLEKRDLPSGWTPLVRTAPISIGPMILLSDGTVMAQQDGVTKNWYRLTPDSFGSYINGTWSQLSSMSLERQFYPSNVLSSGNVFVEGGEYSGPSGEKNLTNKGEIYNPVSNTWSAVGTFPQASFGDDPTELLPDGRVLAGYIFGPQTYIYNQSTNAWSSAATKLRGDRSDEETWVTLPDHSILSYDIFASTDQQVFHAQRYVPAQNQWVDASNLDPTNPPGMLSNNKYYELGGAVLLQDNRVFVLGDTGRTAFYNPATDKWSAGPNVPYGDTAGDEPATEMPNGDVLFTTNGSTTRHAFVFHPSSNTYTDVTPSNYNVNQTYPFMLMLPEGQVLVSNTTNQLAVYTPDSPSGLGRPGVLSIAGTGTTLNLTGTRLNGISEGASFGDDAEMSTNYPLVRFYYSVGFFDYAAYARTFNWSSTGVSQDFAPETTQFTMPSFLPRGIYLVDVVANGIASPLVLNVQMTSSTDNLVIRNDPSNSGNVQIVSGNTVLKEYQLSSIGSIRVSCDGNTDTLTVDYHYGDPVPGGGIDYAGTIGVDTLNVNDQFTTSSKTFYVTSNSVQRAGSAAITFWYYGINHVNVFGGSGNNTYDIESIEPFYPTTIDTGGGTDTVTVKSTAPGSTLAINTTSGAGGNGNDQVTIGNLGSMAGIQGAVSLLNVPSYDHLTLDDTADAVNHPNVFIGIGGVSGLAPAALNFTAASVNRLTINGGTGTNTYTVDGTPVGTSSGTMTLNTGSGADTVRVQVNTVPLTVDTLSGIGNSSSNVTIGNAGSLTGIGAAVTIHNVPNFDTLTIDDSADSGNHPAVTVGSGGVTGLAPSAINFTSASVKALTINGGLGTNTYTIAATPVASPGGMTLNTGTGADTVRVQANTAPLTVDTLAGSGFSSSAVTIGNAGSLAGIGAAVTVHNGPSYDTLTIDDTADIGSHSAVMIGSGGVTGLAPSPINFTSLSVRTLTINGGKGTNTYTVAATPVQSSGSVTLNTGSGPDTVYVQANTAVLTVDTLSGDANSSSNVAIGNSGSLAGIAAAVTIHNNTPGYDVVSINDWADSSSHSAVTVSSSGVTGLAPNPINFTSVSVKSLTVTGGPGTNSYTITGTPVATFGGVLLNTGGGNDTVGVQSASAAVTIVGTGGLNTLIGMSAANSWEVSGTNAGKLTGSAYAVPVSFAGIQNLTAGGGGPDYFLFDDGGRLDGNLAGSGNDTVDYTPYASSVVVDLQTGSATGVGGSLSGMLTVIGGSGAPGTGGVYNLLIGSGFKTLTGGTGRRNILVAGGGTNGPPSTLNAGDGEDLLIGGTTTYDTEAGLVSWLQIAAYWAGTDDYFTRVANLTSGNGVPLLDATTVTGNGGSNVMNGNGALALIYTDGADSVGYFDPNSQVVTIAP
jgi:hypothetical protein